MRWRAEVLDGHTFYRLEVTRYGERLALMCGPTTDGRWQARCGGWRRDTRERAEVGDLLTTSPTANGAKRVARSASVGRGGVMVAGPSWIDAAKGATVEAVAGELGLVWGA